MALPTTITGLNTASSPAIGSFISSGGNVYLFGPNATGQAVAVQKATDPTTAFSSVGDSGAFTEVRWISAYKVSDVIHLIAADRISGTSVTFRYLTFNMSSDTWVLDETILSGLNTQTSGAVLQFISSVVVRSTGEVVAFFSGAQITNMGNSYAQTYCMRRTGVNTWVNISGGAGATQVSAGGTVDFTGPEEVLGTSDRVHFIHRNGSTVTQRALTSANALQTAGTTNFVGSPIGTGTAIAYDDAGTTRVIWAAMSGGSTAFALTFDSGNTPTLTQIASTLGTSASVPAARLFNDGTDAWALYRKTTDSDLYVLKSTDDGANWGSEASAFTGTVGAADINLSIDGNIFTRGSSVVIPHIVNDNGTLKYNEYVVRTLVAAVKQIIYNTNQAVIRAAYW